MHLLQQTNTEKTLNIKLKLDVWKTRLELLRFNLPDKKFSNLKYHQ